MRLRQILEDLVETTPGALGAVLADWEGEAVAAYSSGEETDYNIKFVGAHHGILLARAREMMARLGEGAPRELIFSHREFHVITVPVNHDYYVVLTLRPDGKPAFARAAIRKAVREIEEDIA